MTRTERTYYLVDALYCSSWAVTVPMYPLFLLSRGLDLFQINVILAIFLITSFVLEVPTGAVADVAGRKVAFLLSCAIRMIAFTMYAFAGSFIDCAVAELVDGLGNTLANGALDAWAIDGMRAEGESRPPDRFFARAQMLANCLMIVAGIGGGYLAQGEMARPWFAGAAGFAVTALVGALTMRERRVADVVPRARLSPVALAASLGSTMREGVLAVRRTPMLRLLCVLTVVMSFGMMPTHMLWQPRMRALTGEGTWLMGWIFALLNLASLTGSALIPRLLGRLDRQYVLCAAAVWRGGMLAVVALATGVYPALVGLLLQHMTFGVTEPLLQAWMNEHTAAEQRATVLSVRAMSFTFGGAAGLVCIGLIARDAGMAMAWGVCASVFVLIAPGFLALGRLARRVQAQGAGVEVAGVSPKVIPPALG